MKRGSKILNVGRRAPGKITQSNHLLKRGAQACIHSGFELLQGWRFHNTVQLLFWYLSTLKGHKFSLLSNQTFLCFNSHLLPPVFSGHTFEQSLASPPARSQYVDLFSQHWHLNSLVLMLSRPFPSASPHTSCFPTPLLPQQLSTRLIPAHHCPSTGKLQTGHSTVDLVSVFKEKGRIISLNLLAALVLPLPRMPMAFTATTHNMLVFNSLFPGTCRSFSASCSPLSFVPACTGACCYFHMGAGICSCLCWTWQSSCQPTSPASKVPPQ